jgi:hypothetical protein
MVGDQDHEILCAIFLWNLEVDFCERSFLVVEVSQDEASLLQIILCVAFWILSFVEEVQCTVLVQTALINQEFSWNYNPSLSAEQVGIPRVNSSEVGHKHSF